MTAYDPRGAAGPARRRPTLRLRLVGAFCLVAGVLAIVGAATGWDTDGTPRPALWVAGVVLLLLCLPCLLARGPKVLAASADDRGVTITRRTGPGETIPWDCIATVKLSGIGPPPHSTGWVLDLAAASPSLAEHRRIGRWANPRDGGPGHLILPVPSAVGHALDADLRRCAGGRYVLPGA